MLVAPLYHHKGSTGNGFLTEDEQAEMQSFEKLSDRIARGHERIVLRVS